MTRDLLSASKNLHSDMVGLQDDHERLCIFMQEKAADCRRDRPLSCCLVLSPLKQTLRVDA